MSNKDVAKAQATALAEMDDIFNVEALKDDMSSKGSGFASLSIRGGKFHIRQGGEEDTITDEDDIPVNSLEVVMLKAKPEESRMYYEGEYDPNETTGPTCASLDGVTPDPEASIQVQASTCAACPYSKWGSAISKMTGNKTTACKTFRRVAIVPAPAYDPKTKQVTGPASTILSEETGGAMLLRVPVTSRKNLEQYNKALVKRAVPYNAVVTRLSFDAQASYPILVFKPVRLLTDEEKQMVREVYSTVNDVLGSAIVDANVEVVRDTPPLGEEESDDDDLPFPAPAEEPVMDEDEDEGEDEDEDEDEDEESAPPPPPPPPPANRKKNKKKGKKKTGNKTDSTLPPDPAAAPSDAETAVDELDAALKDLGL